jgi:signal transduction histidine kinase
MIQWFVRTHEHDRITDALMQIKQGYQEMTLSQHEYLSHTKNVFFRYFESDYLHQNITRSLPPQTMFFVFDIFEQRVYGDDWKSFISFVQANKNTPASFLFYDEVAPYLVSFEIGINPTDGIIYKYFMISPYTPPEVLVFNYRSLSLETLNATNDKYLHLIAQHISTDAHIREFTVLRLDTNFSFGIYTQFDTQGKIVMLHTYQYPREVFLFLQRIFLLMMFIVLVSFFILTIVAYSVISKRIFDSIAHLIEKMKFISAAPQQISPVSKSTHGEILQIYEYFNEMVESLQSYQAELSRSDEIFEKIAIGLLRLDSGGRIINANKAFHDFFSADRLDGKYISTLLPIEIESIIWSGNKYEIPHYHHPKNEHDYHITIYRIPGVLEMEYFTMVRDITYENRQEVIRRTLELELIRINRLSEIGKRIQGVVHNLNTPLNSLIGFAQLIIDDMNSQSAIVDSASDISADLQKIISNAKGMSEIIRQLLHKTRDDSISMQMTINLNNLIEQELSFCSHDLFFKHDVQLIVDLCRDIPDQNIVYGDVSLVFQTLFNNAMEAMQGVEKKTLKVASYLCDDFVVLEIQDSGIGMSDDVLRQIWEMGYTTKTQTASSGFGIGLPIVKSIIDRMQGKIEVESEIGVGTKMKVMLRVW